MNYAPGKHLGPNRKDKGLKGKACNVTACQLPDSAVFYNHSTQAHYCTACATVLNRENRAEANRMYGHDLCTRVEDAKFVIGPGGHRTERFTHGNDEAGVYAPKEMTTEERRYDRSLDQ